MQRVLITGGAGFIGSHTSDFLLQEGYEVIVYDNLASGKLKNLNVFHPRLRAVQADVLDFASLAKEIKNVDAVLHLAAISSVPKSIEDPIQSLQVNTQGFVHVLEAIRQSQRTIRLVYASSAAVYGLTTTLPCSDKAPLPTLALSPYALEKAHNERYADLYQRLFGIKSLGLRYFNVYGTRQDPTSPYSGVISKFMQAYQQHELITVFGDGEQSRDFIHVSDVVQANHLALAAEVHGVCNIATGTPETLNNLIQYLEQAGGYTAEVQYREARIGDIPRSYGTIDQAKKLLNFSAQVPLAQGITSLLNNCRAD